MRSGSGWHRTVAAFVATLAVAMTATARQNEGAFDRTFDTAMQRAAPDFRPQPLLPRRDGSNFYREWTFNGARVSVRYFVCESPDSAAELLHTRISVLPIPTKRIDEFADEAYLLA